MKRIARTGILGFVLAGSMVGLGYASVPLYRAFCNATGFAGTTRKAIGELAPGAVVSGKRMSIRFDANHVPTIPWEFKPEKETQTVTIGERSMAFFDAKNLAKYPVTGAASFNVVPEQAGRYFTKIQCFCFTEQTLKAGQDVRMPVIFYVDPKIMSDPDARDIQEITLSYTFYPVDESKKPS